MAQNNANGSNKAKHLRRAKRKNTLLLRTLKERHSQWFTTMTTLLAVLAQHGGECTITQGTSQQAIEGFVKGEVGFDTVAGKVDGEFIVRLVSRAVKPVDMPVDPIVEAVKATIEAGIEAFDRDFVGSGQELGFDSEGEYHYATPVEISDALLATEGKPYENIGWNDAEVDSRTTEEIVGVEFETTATGHEYRGPGWDKAPTNAS